MNPGRAVRTGVLLGAALAGQVGAARVYRVQPGDTLWSLARSNGVTVQALVELNPRPFPTLRVNEVIRLPGGATSSRAARASAPARPAAAWPARPVQVGQAVYYPGRRDARTAMTAAHLTLSRGTWVRVTHRVTGRSVDVLINDRGPFGVPSRIIDLSGAAAAELGILSEGVAPVTVAVTRRP